MLPDSADPHASRHNNQDRPQRGFLSAPREVPSGQAPLALARYDLSSMEIDMETSVVQIWVGS